MKRTNTKLKNLYLILGPSGVGKTTVTDALCDRYGYRCAESYTDRPPRYEGEGGHTFLSEAEFDALEENEEMCAYTIFNSHRYCVTEKMLENSDLYIIDPAGVRYMEKCYHGKKPIVCIGLTQPWDVLRHRMLQRGDSEKNADRRIKHDKEAFAEMAALCDVVIDSAELEKTIAAVLAFINEKERNR